MPTDPRHWFLARDERGNTATDVHSDAGGGGGAWSEGNAVIPLVHGAPYFARLHAELSALGAGDRVWFTDWRGDADERLLPDGPTIGDLLADRARAGVEVRGLIWRSHGERVSASLSARSNELLGRKVNEAGGEVLLDQRVRVFGSHHQKFFVIQHHDDPAADVAFVGGIDLCHSRRDDAAHEGDPQHVAIDARYGDRPAWHDASMELRGPVVADVLAVFAERWDDPHPLDRSLPYRMLLQRLTRMPRHPEPLPERTPPPPPAGDHAVQLLRTYGVKRPPFPFAPHGERSVARAYGKAFRNARSLISIEDQYLWSREVASGIAEALERNRELRVVVLVPRYPNSDGALGGPPARLGQIDAIRELQRTAPDRVGVFDLEHESGRPIYIHAKVCIVDDEWFTIGSDNFNRRSWTSDSELTCAVVGGSTARDLRLELWAEHLATTPDDPRLLGTGADLLALWKASARALDHWHEDGEPGPRPPGRVRQHVPEPVSAWQRLWAAPLARLAADPDGRPRRLRGSTHF
ncbi:MULTISPECIES: phospholipase D family protein [Curtobacterium]|uniref:phospholipase D family protein n=1 Tax=Curtobacterium flaccumfaciens TaxID=2035 RepID=UPI003EE6617A